MKDADPAVRATYFGGLARLHEFPLRSDARGNLQPLYFDRMPFVPCRAFTVTNVPVGVVRGGHAHRVGMQLLLCLHGRVEILMRHRREEIELTLLPCSAGLVFGPGVWCQQTYAARDSVLLVLASEPYDAGSYVGTDTTAG